MNILIISPPGKYSYFNLCYRYIELGELAGYLCSKKYNVIILDSIGCIEKWNIKLLETIVKFDINIVLIHNTAENIKSVIESASIIRKYNEYIYIGTYGIVSLFSPKIFNNIYFDAVFNIGDFECLIEIWLEGINEHKHCSNITITKDIICGGKNIEAIRLKSEDLPFPELNILPVEDYKKVINKFGVIAGLPNTHELSFSISRGCENKCWFCPVPIKEGRKERRKDVVKVIDFIKKSTRKYKFDQISIFSSSVARNKKWLFDFCDKIINENIKIPWRCVSNIEDLNYELIEIMAKSGCWRIGFGIETLNKDIAKKMGKNTNYKTIVKIIKKCREEGIIPLSFLMYDMPKQNSGEVINDARKLTKIGSEVRISKYINYGQMNKSSIDEISNKMKKTVKYINRPQKKY
jgi:radical SAM superfamily enzyme YgiQ (UPF0313 family)